MKVIFLDVDGELTYSDYENDETNGIDIEKVKLLKQICDETSAKVVISSSWRGSEKYTPNVYYVLRDILMDNGVEVIGDTPHIKCEFIEDVSVDTSIFDDCQFALVYGTGRSAEVQKWLSENEVESFVILDDEDYGWEEYGFQDNWIQPTWFGDGGIKEEHVEKAIEILNRK